MVLFLFGMYVFWQSSDIAVSYVTNRLGIDKWVHRQGSDILSFFFLMGEMMVRLILILFYFSLFKYLFLIVGSPVFAYLSEKTESIIEGRDFPFSIMQLMKDIFRGIKLALRNTMWQAVFTISILILSFFPVVGWVTPVIMLFVECYYYGFSMLDYSCERHKLSSSASIDYVTKHKGLAIGNGMMFFLMHLVPFAGWMLAPAYAVVAATLSMYHQKSEP
jgi:CysZ protein